MEQIVKKLENSVIEQKAISILIDNGSEKVIELLKQVEADLLIIEQTASKDEEKVKEEFEKAQKTLEQFELFCENELEALDDPVIDRSLALDYWENVIVSSIDEVAEKAAKRISEMNLNEVRKNANEQIVNEVFSEVVLPKATNWANDIRSGENAAFKSLLDSKIKKIIRNTEKEWELLLEEQPILSGLPVPTPVIGTDVMATDFIDSVIAKTPGVSKDVWVGSAAGAAIGATIGSFVFPGIGTLVGGVLGGALGAAAGDGIGTDRRENFIKEELKKELTQNIVLGDNSESETKRSILNKQEKRIRVLRKGVIGAFEAAFADTQSAFLTRQSEALKIYELETAQRTALAKKHTELRTVQIEPLRKKIETYERSFGCSGGTDGTDVNIASVDNKTPFSAVAEEQNLWMDCRQKDEESDVICIDPAKVAAGLAEINIDRTKGIKFSADGRILERYSPNFPDNIYHIPYGITAIAPDAFADCDNIESVVIPDSVICIGERAFKYSGLEEIVLPGSLKKISAESFAGCWYLKKVVILQGVTEIEPQAFCGCSALDTVIIPESITKIASDAFLNSPCERSIMERYGSLFSTTGNG